MGTVKARDGMDLTEAEDIKKRWQETQKNSAKKASDSDCRHEIKSCLLPGRKAMTNLDSILKSRDITLPTKVHIIKAVVFLVVMYGCENWTTKKSES